MAQQTGRTFEDMQQRLEQIVDEVAAEDISLDDALKLYEEAVKLGLAACDLSETDVEAYLAASSAQAEEAEGEAPADGVDGSAGDGAAAGDSAAEGAAAATDTDAAAEGALAVDAAEGSDAPEAAQAGAAEGQ